MAAIAPNVVGLFPAKRLHVDIQKRELSLIGIFPLLTFQQFPTPPLGITVFAMVNGGRGEGILELAVHSLSTTNVEHYPGDWIYRQRKWIRFLDDPNYTTTLEVRVRDLIFAEPGHCLFVLSFDGEPVTERRLSVNQGSNNP